MFVMCHHIHGEGYPQRQGSVAVEQLEAVIRKYPDYTYTFDDGTADQRLALPILSKYNIKGYFFLSNLIAIERDKWMMAKMGLDTFYKIFFQFFPYCKMPDDFLAEYNFYSIEDRRFRYIRDYQCPEGYRDFMDTTFACDDVPELFLHPAELKAHFIGLHAFSHPADMGLLKPSQQFDEWMLNLQYLSEFQDNIRTASHPMGRYSLATLKILKLIGITQAFCSKEGDRSDLEIGREDIINLI